MFVQIHDKKIILSQELEPWPSNHLNRKIHLSAFNVRCDPVITCSLLTISSNSFRASGLLGSSK